MSIKTNNVNIKKLRTKKGMTQTEFAKWLGCTQITISKWENGQCPEYIEKLAGEALKNVSNIIRILE